MFEEVGEPCDYECEDEGGRPRGYAVQLGAYLRVAVGFDDAGCEEGVAVGGDDETEVHEAAEEELVVLETIQNVAKGDLAFARGAALVFLQASSDVCAFVFTQPVVGQLDLVRNGWEVLMIFSSPFGFFGKVWDHEIESECDYA